MMVRPVRAAPTLWLRRRQEEREKSREGAIYWSEGANLVVASTGVLSWHPVQRGGREEREVGKSCDGSQLSPWMRCKEVQYTGLNFTKLAVMMWPELSTTLMFHTLKLA